MSLTDDDLRALLEGATEQPDPTGVVDRVAARRARRRARRHLAVASGALAVVMVAATAVVRTRQDSTDVDRVAAGGGHTPPATADPASSPGTGTGDVRLVRVGPGGAAAFGGGAWVSGEVANEPERHVLVRLDPAGGRVAAVQVDHPVAALAVDPGGREVWAVGGGDGAVPTGSVTRVDATTNRVTGHLDLPGGAPASAAVLEGSVWVGDSSAGRLWRVDRADARLAETIDVGGTARSVAAAGDTVWVANGEAVVRVDPATNRVKGRTPLPRADAVAATRSVVWAGAERSLARLDPSSGRALSTVALLAHPGSLALGSGWVWVTESTPEEPTRVSRVEAERGRVDPRPVYEVSGLAYGAFVAGDQLWVLDSTRADVVRLDLPMPTGSGLDLPGETLPIDGETVALVSAVDPGASTIAVDLVEQYGPGPDAARVAGVDGEHVSPGDEVGYRRNRDGRRHQLTVRAGAALRLLDAASLNPVDVDLATLAEALSSAGPDGRYSHPSNATFRVRLAGGEVVLVEQLYHE